MENSQLLEHIGKTKTKKLLDEITKEYYENKKKVFPISQNLLNPSCIVSVIKEKEIKGIGMSCINDLLLDNFGVWYSAIFSGNQTGEINNVGDVSEEFDWNGESTAYNNSVTPNVIGSKVQVGQGLTPASIGDFTIETPFGVAPESNRNNTGIGTYTVGLSQIFVPSAISPTTGSGDISEAGLAMRWRKPSTGLVTELLITHDNISPVVPFLAGNAINIDYTIQI